MKTEGQINDLLVGNLIVAIIVLITVFGLSTAQHVVAEETQSLDCTDCHSIAMQRHRFPTSPCKSCHSSDMATLTLRDGKVIPIEESDPLCAECHTEVFQAWIGGQHGTADFKCVACHDSHSEDKMLPRVEASSSISWILKIIAVAGLFIGAGFLALMPERLQQPY